MIAGLSFAPPQLVDRILDDIGVEEGRLPLLQFALKETWERREGDRLTAEAYIAVGGVAGAIEKTAQSAYERLNPSQKEAARRLFLRLVTPVDGNDYTRARSVIPDDPEQREIIRLFSSPSVRLLVTNVVRVAVEGKDESTAQQTVEMAHDALIQRWSTLKGWMAETREKLVARGVILRAQKEWEENRETEKFLLDPGLQLERGRALLENPGDIPVDDIRDYVERSIERDHRRLEAEREAALARDYKESQRAAQIRAEELFQSNLRTEAIIQHVEILKAPFHSQVSWHVTPGMNVLLGRNGYGKTLLLRILLALLQYEDQIALQTLGNGAATVHVFRNGIEAGIHFADQFFEEKSAVGKLPILAIPDARFVDRSNTTLRAVRDESTGSGERTALARHGALHFLAERPYDGMIQSFLYGLCLDYFEEGMRFKGEQFGLVRDVVRELTDQVFDFDRVIREGRDSFSLYVRTEGNSDNPLPIQECSQGTLSVIAMFGLIYDFLKSLEPGMVSSITDRQGIVVVDEVDAHLHPVWQHDFGDGSRGLQLRSPFLRCTASLVGLSDREFEPGLNLRLHDLSRHLHWVRRALSADDCGIDIAHSRHRVGLRFERTFDNCNDAARPARQEQVDRVARAPANRLASHELAVAVEQYCVRLGLGVDIDADGRAVVARPMLDSERAATDA
jgi:hypothetical protein